MIVPLFVVPFPPGHGSLRGFRLFWARTLPRRVTYCGRKRKGGVMKQPIENSLPMVKAAKRLGFRSLGVLLVIALLGLAAQAETFSFQLVKAPIALNPLNPTSESIRLSGGGTFDPALGAVAASGTFTLFNAFDHPNGPTVNGTWHATGFVSFTPLGSSDD